MSFDQVAHEYEELIKKSAPFETARMNWFVTPKKQRIVRTVRNLDGDRSDFRILDLGCGIGLLTEALQELKSELVGIDTSELCVEAAKHRVGARIQFGVAKGNQLPGRDAEFDLIVLSNVLHHVDPKDRLAFMKEARRVLKPKGSIIVFEHNPSNPMTRKMVRDCPFDEGVSLLRPEEVDALLGQVGMKVRESEHYLFVPAVIPQTYFFDRLVRKIPLGAQHFTWAS